MDAGMTLLVVVAVVVVVVVVGVVWWAVERRGKSEGVGFWEFVKRPELARGLSASLRRHRDAIETLSVQDPASVVALLLVDDAYAAAIEALRRMGARATPALVAALADPRFRERIPGPERKKQHALSSREQPVEGVLRVLAELADPALAGPIGRMDGDLSDWARRHRARVAAATGQREALPIVLEALTDDDDYLRGAAMSGVLRAAESGVIEPAFRDAAYSAIRPLVTRKDRTVSGRAPECLLAIDRPRAEKELLSEACLSAGSEGLMYTLRALRASGVTVPDTSLARLFRVFRDEPGRHPHSRVLIELVGLAASDPTPDNEVLLRAAAELPSTRVRAAVVEARLAEAGIASPWAFILGHLRSRGWEASDQVFAHCGAVRWLIDEVSNGGFAQYFVNSSGDRWREALAGLEAMHSEHHARVLRAAVDRFGAEPPSEDRERRRRQLSRLVRGQSEPFGDLEEEFYETLDELELLALRYIADNRDVLVTAGSH